MYYQTIVWVDSYLQEKKNRMKKFCWYKEQGRPVKFYSQLIALIIFRNSPK